MKGAGSDQLQMIISNAIYLLFQALFCPECVLGYIQELQYVHTAQRT